MAIYTRLFKEKDFSQITDLLQLYYELGYPTTRNELIHRLNEINTYKDYYMLLLIEDNQIIGFSGMCRMMFYENNGKYTCILAFVVNSKFREKGLGSLLLKESDKLNCKAMTVNSGIRTERKKAHEFYKAYGFEKILTDFLKISTNDILY